MSERESDRKSGREEKKHGESIAFNFIDLFLILRLVESSQIIYFSYYLNNSPSPFFTSLSKRQIIGIYMI